MKHLSFTRLSLGSALLLAIAPGYLMAQSEPGSNSIPQAVPSFVDLRPAAPSANVAEIGRPKSSKPAIPSPDAPLTDALTSVPTATRESWISVKPATLSPIIRDEPLWFQKYGEVPAVALLTFGHK
jgi:hypothetical protein